MTEFEPVIRKYLDEAEIEELSRGVARGLADFEQALVDRFLSPGAELLDVGCGAGREAIALSRQGFRVTGIDLSPAMVDRARENARAAGLALDFRQMNACRLEFSDAAFDGVLLLHSVIAGIPGSANRQQALREAVRVVRPGGSLLLCANYRFPTPRHSAYWMVVDSLRVFGLTRRVCGTCLEPGDRVSTVVSPARTAGEIVVHYHTRREAVETVEAAGARVLDLFFESDLSSAPGRQRRFLLLAARKP